MAPRLLRLAPSQRGSSLEIGGEHGRRCPLGPAPPPPPTLPPHPPLFGRVRAGDPPNIDREAWTHERSHGKCCSHWIGCRVFAGPWNKWEALLKRRSLRIPLQGPACGQRSRGAPSANTGTRHAAFQGKAPLVFLKEQCRQKRTVDCVTVGPACLGVGAGGQECIGRGGGGGGGSRAPSLCPATVLLAAGTRLNGICNRQ